MIRWRERDIKTARFTGLGRLDFSAANQVPDVYPTHPVLGRYCPLVCRDYQAFDHVCSAPEHISVQDGLEIPHLDFSVEAESDHRIFVWREGHGGDLIVVATQRGQLKMRFHIPQLRAA